ncbi:hypothetical protein BH23GEM3_BH23GEM3_14910 [soil metagenome]|nr:chemotaxis protein CheA [Gemmatimonadota bacterium]
MLGFTPVRDYVHGVETVFKDALPEWPQLLVDQLFQGAAALRRLVELAGSDEEAGALARITALPPLSAVIMSGTPPAPRVEPAPPGEDPGGPPAEEPPEAERSTAPEDLHLSPSTDMLRVPFAKLDALMSQVADLVSVHAAIDELLERHRPQLDGIGLRRPLQARAEQLERSAEAVRTATMELRLVPVSRVFTRFPSLVRDLARDQGKKIQVVLEGEDTELDKSTVDILAEPLLHLVRNAVDHGIGTPEQREALGKPPEGTLTLRAAQSGDQVRIEVQDDGTGLDRERILTRAMESGLVSANEHPSDVEVAELIFQPGFSTRQETSMVSGRGVGLDVVARSVARLRGRLEVEDTPGDGTRFVLFLPLTVAIVPALLFQSDGEILALPAMDVEEAIRPGATDRAGAADVVRYGDELIPLARPARLFGWNADRTTDDVPAPFAMVVRRGTRTAAVVADRLLEQRDVVVTALPPYLGHPPGVSGATIAPDGRVVLLIDAGGLIDLNLEFHRRESRA